MDKKKYTKKCLVCDTEFTTNYSRQIYCSTKCQRKKINRDAYLRQTGMVPYRGEGNGRDKKNSG